MQTANNKIFFTLQMQMEKFLEKEYGASCIMQEHPPKISRNAQHVFIDLLIERCSVMPYPETELITVFFHILGTLEESSFFIFKPIER